VPTQLAPDDVVHDRASVVGREPLILVEPLRRFLDALGIGVGEPEVVPVGDGHSNVTLVIRRGDRRFVLRRPPRGPLPPSAHDVLREARIIAGLRGHARVPEVLAVAEDDSVIGAPFFVMDFVDGHVLQDAMPAVLDGPDSAGRVAGELVSALAEIHGVDWAAAGLAGLGRPDGYLARQLRRFLGLWEHNRTRDVPQVQRIADWLSGRMPASATATLVHGDFRLGNVIYAPEAPPRLVAVLDWEMATLGDPLADVGYMSTLWCGGNDQPLARFGVSGLARAPGFPSRDEIVARYEEASGRAVVDLAWYQTFALWKTAVFMEGNYRRAQSGATDDAMLADAGETVLATVEQALECAQLSAGNI
jgi:aminoglycoside phosphotransferase (APT) family kinase protein